MAARARELDEENEREKGAREAAVKTAKEKAKIAEAAEKKAAAAEKFRAMAEKRCTDLLARQNETELKLAEALSLNTSHADEIADLRAGLAAAEQKWYDVGFAVEALGIPSTRVIGMDVRLVSSAQGTAEGVNYTMGREEIGRAHV